ncbi:MAG: ribonuclease P protein component [Acidimicrobiales bacterium]|nr:ribonuclease P protein component [Hyphomonadaceae bacterium]RZV41934.1 MAG: ribonuclease P protein component [Acidimicrobiales bacterium]
MTHKKFKLGRLKKRAEFLFVAERGSGKGRFKARPGIVIQARKNLSRTAGIDVGFTATKKIGNAVTRNKAKRRLRACAQAILPTLGEPGYDYVFIARAETATMDWKELQAHVEKAVLALK